jgi:rubrerythrin
MPRFVCPTCGATLYSASPLTKCPWCGTAVPAPREDADESDEGEETDE